MSEHLNESVAVIFRQGGRILVPPDPLQVPYENRRSNETFEKTAYRLAADYGVLHAKIDAPLRTSDDVDAATRAYLLHDPAGMLERSEFYVEEAEVMNRIFQHPTLRVADVALFTTALYAIRLR